MCLGPGTYAVFSRSGLRFFIFFTIQLASMPEFTELDLIDGTLVFAMKRPSCYEPCIEVKRFGVIGSSSLI